MPAAGIAQTLAVHATAWLATYALHSTLLVGLAWLASGRLARRSVRLEEAAWRSALLGALATATLQVATGWEPVAGSVHLRALPAAPVAVAAEMPSGALAAPGLAATPPAGEAVAVDRENVAAGIASTLARGLDARSTGTPRPAGSISAIEPPATTAPHGPGASSPSVADHAAVSSALPGNTPALSWPSAVALLWLVAAAALALRLGLSHLVLRRRLYGRPEISGGTMLRLLRRLAPRAGLKGPVRLSCSHRVPVPVALGVVRPEICVPPRALSHLEPEQQESLLAHELAHLVRRDPLWLAASQVLASVLFFQPLNWVARRRLREISELLCDEWAVARTGRPLSLAGCLAEVAQWSLPAARPLTVPCLADRRSQLGLRIRRLLAGEAGSPAGLPRWGFAAMAGLLLLVAAVVPGVSASRGEAKASAGEASPAAEVAEAVEAAEEVEDAEDAESVEAEEDVEAVEEAEEVEAAELPEAPESPLAPEAPLPGHGPGGALSLPAPRPLSPAQRAQLDAFRVQAEAMADGMEMSDEEIDALVEQAESLSESFEATLQPQIEKIVETAASLEALADLPELDALEDEIADLAEKLSPQDAALEQLGEQIEQLVASGALADGEGELSREQIDKLSEDARRMAETMRPKAEELEKLRTLTEQHRRTMEELRQKQRGEIDALRRKLDEEMRVLRESLEPALEEHRRQMRERSRQMHEGQRLRDEERRKLREEIEKGRMERDEGREERQRLRDEARRMREKEMRAHPRPERVPKAKPEKLPKPGVAPASPAPPAQPAPTPRPALAPAAPQAPRVAVAPPAPRVAAVPAVPRVAPTPPAPRALAATPAPRAMHPAPVPPMAKVAPAPRPAHPAPVPPTPQVAPPPPPATPALQAPAAPAPPPAMPAPPSPAVAPPAESAPHPAPPESPAPPPAEPEPPSA